MKAPQAKKVPTVLEKHGDKRQDPYYWLRERENEEVLEYLNAENDYTTASLKHTESLQDELYHEIVARIKEEDRSAPFPERDYLYYHRFAPGQEYPIYCRSKIEDPDIEEIILDVNGLAREYDFYHATSLRVSPTGEYLAFGEDTVSRRIYSIRFKHLETSAFLEDVIANTTGSPVWANDGKTVFYTRRDDTLRPYKVYRHVLGTSTKEDVEVYHEEDETYRTGIGRSKSGRYLIIQSASTYSTEYRLLDADNPAGDFQVFCPREPNHEYSLAHDGDRFLILTNRHAQNFKLMTCKVRDWNQGHWETLIDHDPQVLLDDVEAFGDHFAIRDRKDGLPRIRVFSKAGTEQTLDFDQATYDVDFHINREYHTKQLRIVFTSLATPNTIMDVNLDNGTRQVIKVHPVEGDFDASNYITQRVQVPSHDGEDVPMSIVYHKDTKLDGSSPALLYGYGSYGITIDPYFSPARISLLDRGFVFCIAHIRGGEDKGRWWYEDGKYLKKKNTFKDFIACGEYLIKHRYSHPNLLCGMGGSAGGLLIGATINMRPTPFRAAIAAVPFVDVVTTMLDETIPLTTGEYSEWGNPNDPEYYHYIKSYSPYDNVMAAPYPALLVTTGLHDSQVQYWEPAKWVAKLRDVKQGDNILLLHTDMETGHGGASGRYKRYRETALQYAFLLDIVGK
ncbi:MAG: S9 family peptidase [Saprospiraceae bacterium]|nr:S9 family peptidase [Saprospiraceae bacterium]